MGAWGDKLKEKRVGVMLHYDASASDPGAVSWLTKDPRCKVSYNWLVLDDGKVVTVAPRTARAWHAGVCRPSSEAPKYKDANSAFYGIAVAATAGDTVTEAQENAVIDLVDGLFAEHRWSRTLGLHRIVGHNTECWPRGRKSDPEGPNPSKPVLSVEAVREAIREG
jgi:N-acetyl-anhydromuramyl-L-alanine amidase AmpD